MPFKIIINQQYQIPSINLINADSFCEAEVFCFGAILNKFSIINNGKIFNVIDAYENIKDAIEQKKTWFKSCKLSPFVCRLQDGMYEWNNIKYTINKFYLGKNAMHGLVYDAVYNIIKTEETNEFALVELQHQYTATDAGYPFNFTINIIYKLEKNNKLTITTIVLHNNPIAIPYCDGWHPYFKLDEPIDNCTLQFDADELLEFDERLIPTGVVTSDDKFINEVLLKNIELDNCYILNKNKQSKCVLKSNNLKLSILPKSSYKYLQVFIPDHRKNIAIENLSAAPNAFNNKMGLSILEPNKKYVFETSLVLENC